VNHISRHATSNFRSPAMDMRATAASARLVAKGRRASSRRPTWTARRCSAHSCDRVGAALRVLTGSEGNARDYVTEQFRITRCAGGATE